MIYTGAESKIQMNNAAPPVKMSSMTKLCNVETLWIITLQATFCLVAAASAVTLNYRDDVKCNMYIWGPKDNDLSNWDRANCIQHTNIGEDKVAYFFIKFFNYVLIFTNFVPIAHVLTLDVVKLMQSSFMENDLKMYHEFKDLFGVTQVRHGAVLLYFGSHPPAAAMILLRSSLITHLHPRRLVTVPSQEFPMVARTLELSEELGMVVRQGATPARSFPRALA